MEDEDRVGKDLVGNKERVRKNQVDNKEQVGKDMVGNNCVDDHRKDKHSMTEV